MKKCVVVSVLFFFGYGVAQNVFEPANGYFGIRTGFIELEEVDDEGSFNMGLFGGIFITTKFTLDASVDFQSTEFIWYLTDVHIDFTTLERKTTALQAGLTFSPFPNSPFRPFLLGGVGYFYSQYTSDYYGIETVGDGGYYAGFGADFLGFNSDDPGFTLTVDARWLFTREEPYTEQEIEADGRMISIGLKYKF